MQLTLLVFLFVLLALQLSTRFRVGELHDAVRDLTEKLPSMASFVGALPPVPPTPAPVLLQPELDHGLLTRIVDKAAERWGSRPTTSPAPPVHVVSVPSVASSVTTTMTICLMDANERVVLDELKIDPKQRRAKLIHNNHEYMASHQDLTGRWIYRRALK